jgi:hypothetical protein
LPEPSRWYRLVWLVWLIRLVLLIWPCVSQNAKINPGEMFLITILPLQSKKKVIISFWYPSAPLKAYQSRGLQIAQGDISGAYKCNRHVHVNMTRMSDQGQHWASKKRSVVSHWMYRWVSSLVRRPISKLVFLARGHKF